MDSYEKRTCDERKTIREFLQKEDYDDYENFCKRKCQMFNQVQ